MLVVCWGLPQTFQGTYAEDYEIINGERTWKDNYNTTIFDDTSVKERVLEQPIPDYIRWFQTNGQLHYLSYEKTAASSDISLLQQRFHAFRGPHAPCVETLLKIPHAWASTL